MLSTRTVLFAGIVVGLVANAARADTMTAFGVQYTSLGGATLSSTATGGVQVSNIGSSGNDGVQLTPLAGTPAWANNFFIDTSMGFGAVPTGAYIEETNYGPVSGGVAPVVSTLTATAGSSGGTLSADFPNSPSGQPITIDYYSGGPDGTLMYHETTTGPAFAMDYYLQIPDTISSDWDYSNWPDVATEAEDSYSTFGAITTVGGTMLPASDDIDFIGIAAPTNIQTEYSSISLTGGGGLGGFAITGEALVVPEPSSIFLGGIALTGLALACLLRYVCPPRKKWTF
jgi:hypothetical protein